MNRKFSGSFTQQEGMSEEAIAAAVAVLRSGRLHRYNLAPGEEGEVAGLEAEFRDWQGSDYCLAVASGGQAMQIALRACGVAQGDPVLTNSFTLAPVPGAIAAVGGKPVLIEVDENLRLDIDDLVAKADSTGARFLLLSHMRGHLCDMERLMKACDASGITVIEDCAHTMGAKWKGKRSGNFGAAACFSTQTYKHMNSGEGGLLTTSDASIAARATMLSGSYMLYGRHGAGPDASAFEDARYQTPNCSARMDHLRAAILRPQLRTIENNITRWNERYRIVERKLAGHGGITTIERPADEEFVGSSIQFRLPQLDAEKCAAFIAEASSRGVEVKWFGADEPAGFTSAHSSWRYFSRQSLPRTDHILATLFDMRLPLTFSERNCGFVGELLCEALEAAMARNSRTTALTAAD